MLLSAVCRFRFIGEVQVSNARRACLSFPVLFDSCLMELYWRPAFPRPAASLCRGLCWRFFSKLACRFLLSFSPCGRALVFLRRLRKLVLLSPAGIGGIPMDGDAGKVPGNLLLLGPCVSKGQIFYPLK